jgi:DNA-binding MarR family transcriptional regulator
LLSMLTNRAKPTQAGACSSDEAFREMLRYFGLLRRVMEPFFAGYGISVSQWGVLRVLQRADGDGHPGVRQMDLGQRLLVRPPSVTGVVRRLTAMGLVKTVPSDDDHRVRLVSLTAKGKRLVDMVGEAHAGRVREIYAALDEQELAGLSGSLSKLCHYMEELGRGTGEKEQA